MEDDRLYC